MISVYFMRFLCISWKSQNCLNMIPSWIIDFTQLMISSLHFCYLQHTYFIILMINLVIIYTYCNLTSMKVLEVSNHMCKKYWLLNSWSVNLKFSLVHDYRSLNTSVYDICYYQMLCNRYNSIVIYLWVSSMAACTDYNYFTA